MRIVTFHFSKISIEKLSDSFKGAKVNSKINISDIKVVESETIKDKKEGIVRVNFAYDINYDPDMVEIKLEGKILLVLDKDQLKEVQENWKTKKMSEEFRVSLFNVILRKANVKALELEEELNIPLHVPLPTLKKQDKQ
jgi:hypothetical protein